MYFFFFFKEFFRIKEKSANRFITINYNDNNLVLMAENESRNLNQLWFWDQQFLRNKADPSRVLGIDVYSTDDNERFGRLKSFPTKGTNSPSVTNLNSIIVEKDTTSSTTTELQFEIQEGELICKWDNLDFRISYNESNRVVGCTDRDDSNPQKWELLYGKAINS